MAPNRILILLVFGLPVTLFIWHTDQAVTQENPVPTAKPTFVSSETCKSCHAERHETWLQTAPAYPLREPPAEVVGRSKAAERIPTVVAVKGPGQRHHRLKIGAAWDATPSGGGTLPM